ncbi:MAG: hypothetical protein HY260_12715, partial [Chloroflexi bacterium]|nr:hypothetical protein [Chloroflexota bacterium]
MALGLLVVVIPLGWVATRALTFGGDATHSPLLSSRTGFWQAAWLAFRASPIWGTGPGTFPTDLMWSNSMPPARPYLHAHNSSLATRHPSPSLESRARWAGIVAAFAGFAVHSLADDHTRYLSLAIPLVVLLALALADRSNREDAKNAKFSFHASLRTAFRPVPVGRITLPTRRRPRLRRRAVHAILLVPSLASLLFTAYSFRAQSIGEMAIDSALDGNWKASAGQFDLAAQADPQFAFYWLESGYAYGVLAANGDAASLDAAIGRTERGLALEPDYALNHANLGALYWQAGRRDDAMREMRRAVELAPAASLFRLNVGLFEEATGDGDAALRDYRAALDLDPALAAGVLWPTTPLRASALDGWRAAREPDRPPRTAAQFTAKARSEIAAGDLSSAERDLSAAWQIDSQSSAVYLGFAELALARGELSQADGYLRAALWVQTQSNAEKVAPLLAWAELAARQGDTDAALVRYRQAFD